MFKFILMIKFYSIDVPYGTYWYRFLTGIDSTKANIYIHTHTPEIHFNYQYIYLVLLESLSLSQKLIDDTQHNIQDAFIILLQCNTGFCILWNKRNGGGGGGNKSKLYE